MANPMGVRAVEQINLPSADSTAYAASKVAKASGGILFGLTGYNSGPAQWIQIYDAAALPANGAVPKIIFKVEADTNFSYDTGSIGLQMDTGIVVGNSTTGPTKTIGAADCWFNVFYK